MDMKFKLHCFISKTIEPKSRFIKTITSIGDELVVEFSNSPKVHRYRPSKEVRNIFMKNKDPQLYGSLYNKHLKGTSYARTLYVNNV
jgi:hypothetical protein